MHSTRRIYSPPHGGTLPVVLMASGVIGIMIAATMALTNFSYRSAHGRADWTAAFYHAENAVQWAAQRISDTDPASASNSYSAVGGSLDLNYMAAALSDGDSSFKNAWVSIVRPNAGLPDLYSVTASAQVGNKVRTIRATVTKNPPSRVFDYEYFLNNWGWWWGASITGNGGNRANWDFDFRNRPVVNGLILANGTVTDNGVAVDPFGGSPPFRGSAGSDPLSNVHWGVPREKMPNLKDFTYYQQRALNGDSNGLWVGTSQVVWGVHTNATQPGLYLEGTDSAPIIISNTVVVNGDVVIKGKITGRGTLYVGGNLYIAGDVTYKNGPDWSTPPETMPIAQRDQWTVDNKNKALIAFAVRESILGGNVNSTDWKGYCYDAATYGLKNVGNEATLGQDGIPHTGDDGIPFDHHDGTSNSAWYDADGDGAVDANFNYGNQIAMTTNRMNAIANYPTNALGLPSDYETVASNDMNLLDGIFYTNHAAAMRLAKNNSIIHGVVVSRDEAIVFNSSLNMYYDSRVHSRYNKNPNIFIDLGLPMAGVLSLSDFEELTPDASNL